MVLLYLRTPAPNPTTDNHHHPITDKYNDNNTTTTITNNNHNVDTTTPNFDNDTPTTPTPSPHKLSEQRLTQLHLIARRRFQRSTPRPPQTSTPTITPTTSSGTL